MKIKIALLTASFLAFGSLGFALSTPTTPLPSFNQTSAAETRDIEGELQVGKTQSVILYVGAETGDYAAYCFTNTSKAGRTILAACKNKQQCKVVATLKAGACKVPGLEADLSDSGQIVTVKSAKALRSKK